METKANYALIGAFTVAGFLGILGFLMWFAKLELNRQFAYYDVYFREISGLSVSSQVQFAGLNVGQVITTELATNGAGVVRVRLELNEDTPVRVDSAASINTSAVTGVSIVTITPGTPDAALLRETSEDPVPVIGNSRSTMQTLEKEAPELLSRLNVLADQASQLLGDENRQRVANILINVERASENLNDTMDDVSRATDAVASVANDLAGFGEKLDTLSASADRAMTSFTGATDQARTTLARVDTFIDSDLSPLTGELREDMAMLSEDLDRLSTRAEGSLGKLDTALETATGTMGAAHELIDTLGPVFTDLRSTLGKVSGALANLPQELPRIVTNIGDAADAAASAFESLNTMLEGARTPVRNFSREGLPQYSRLAQELRALVTNINSLVSDLRRNPAQILRGHPTPEFRR